MSSQRLRQDALDAAVWKTGDVALAVRGDVSNPADLDTLYERIRNEAGHVDVVFANAGFAELSRLGRSRRSLRAMFAINVKCLLFTIQKALPLFFDGLAVIRNGSSVFIKRIKGTGIYNATKVAVCSFART